MLVVLKTKIHFLILILTTILLASKVVELEAAWNDQCQSDSDCTGSHYCCKKRFSYEQKVCASDCLFESCAEDDDCAYECCDSNHECRNYCSKSSSAVSEAIASWVIAVIVISVIVVLVIPISIVICCCYCGAAAASSRPAAGVVLAQPVSGTTIVAAQNIQTQPYPMAMSPQQGYNNYPVQQTNMAPPPYK